MTIQGNNPYETPGSVPGDSESLIEDERSTTFTSAVACTFLGLMFVMAMHLADFDGETAILFTASGVLCLLSIAAPLLSFRSIVPMVLLFPFCLFVTCRHVGDMGPTHMIDGGIYTFFLAVFFVIWVSSMTAKWIML